MSRDYKHSGKPRQSSRGGVPPLLPFLSGLCLGLLVAFFIYLNDIHPAKDKEGVTISGEPRDSGTGNAAPAPRPRFDFYTILPEREVKVPEWELTGEKEQSPATTTPAPSSYILQVGSFQRYAEADRVKAKLALLGIQASIQKVVINGQDVWYRVRVGPFRSSEELNRTRRKLAGNGMDFILLRIRGEEQG
ncbi:MAG: SPOR domain-containing protein [Gammaproteobacteria bacterium]|nr:MAG: SPOR domain-containing protein [Gammaproteobacteria bacterium]